MGNRDVHLTDESSITRVPQANIRLGVITELWETEGDRIKIDKILRDCDLLPDNLFVAIGVTASSLMKQWPQGNYARLICRMSAVYSKIKFFVLGDSLCQKDILDNRCNVLNLCGQLTLRETVALLRRVTLYIGNDTGLMHIASACGCALVEVSSFAREGDEACGVSSSRFFPWSREALIVQPLHQMEGCTGMCQMPYEHCITQVSVEAVVESACRLLAARGIVAG